VTVLALSTLYSVEEAYHSIIRVEREREGHAPYSLIGSEEELRGVWAAELQGWEAA
jgi:hypothetical protein